MNKTATISISDEVHAKIQMSEMMDVRYLSKKYALPVKNHFFNPRYKVGAWDGKLHFFTTAGNTYNYLLPDIIGYLVRGGYEVELDDKRSRNIKTFEPVKADDFKHIIYPETGEPVEIAEHQLRCINALLAEPNGIMEAATGAGKTIMTAAMCDRFIKAGLVTIVIVPNLDLIENTRDELIMMGIDDIGVLSGVEKDLDHKVVVSTWQSLKNIPFIMKQFTCVLVDETHGARGPELKKILIEYGQHIVHRYGMTGTMPDDECEAMSVHIALGPVRETVTAAELIAIGWLASVDIQMLELQEDLQAEFAEFKKNHFSASPITYLKFKQKYFPDYTAEKAYLIKNKTRLQWIANFLETLRENQGNTFVLVASIDQGKKLAELCTNSQFVYGKDKVKARKTIYNLFKENDDMLVYATVNIAGTGINIKRIFNLVTIDIGKSFIRVIQCIGRGLRKGRGKDHLKVYDIGSDLKYGTKHSKERQKYYKSKEYPFEIVKVDYSNA